MLEIERTYLVKSLPGNLESCPHEEIRQGYLSETVNEPSPLRIRQKGEKFELTKKFRSTSDLSTAEEVNLPLNKEEFLHLWPSVIKFIVKTRYYLPLDYHLTAELDIFHGKMEGLMFVEVEFVSKEAMTNFTPPDWFGADITDESWSSNSFLAGSSYDDVRDLVSA